MSTIVEQIGKYVQSVRCEDIPPGVLDYSKRLFLDGLACMFGGLDSAPARLVHDTVAELGGTRQATLIHSGRKTTAQHAALANGVALRFPDFNDIYYGPAWAAHCSDSLAALLAVAEWRRRPGIDLLLAMILTYEVQLRFSDLPVEKNLWHRGWQLTVACACASAAGISRLLELNETQTAHAIALAGARTNTFSEIRRGNIAMDKAFSEPIAASASIFYALLAERNFTACLTILEGRYGFRHAVAGGVDVTPLVPQVGDFRISKVAIKPYPVQGMTPAMVQAALELRTEHDIRPDDIEAVQILAPEEAITKPSWDPTKLKPDSKETADHSFHYCVAVALVAGEVTSRQFEREWIESSAVRGLIDKTTLTPRADLTALFQQGARPAAIEVRTRQGTFYREVLYPRGDPKNPMTWDDVKAKFMSQAASLLGERRALQIVERVSRLEKEKNVARLVKLLAAR